MLHMVVAICCVNAFFWQVFNYYFDQSIWLFVWKMSNHGAQSIMSTGNHSCSLVFVSLFTCVRVCVLVFLCVWGEKIYWYLRKTSSSYQNMLVLLVVLLIWAPYALHPISSHWHYCLSSLFPLGFRFIMLCYRQFLDEGELFITILSNNGSFLCVCNWKKVCSNVLI